MAAKKRLTGQQRREQILEKALDIFAEKGFSGARTRQIAEAAGVSETLVFKHFASKEELYAQAVQHMFSHHPVWDEAKEAIERLDDQEVLFTVARHMIKHGRQDPRITRLIIFSAMDGLVLPNKRHARPLEGAERPPEQVVSDYIARRIKDGAFRAMEPGVAARLFLYMVFQIIADHHLAITGEPLKLSDDEAAMAVTRLFLDGVRA